MHAMSSQQTAALCSKCSASLPEGSQFCPKCGQRVATLAEGGAEAVVSDGLCTGCGAKLPENSQYCPNCARATKLLEQSAPVKDLPAITAPLRSRARPRRSRFLIPLLLLIFVGLFLWALGSDSPLAQDIQELFGWKQDQVIVETPFSVGPHNLQYFKISLPEGSVNVSIVGEFAATDSNDVKPGRATNKNSANSATAEDNIEVFVLTESAFTVWQNGYSTGSLYESGRVEGGKFQADIPPGAGIYYLVFSNRSASKTAKRVRAAVFLRYRNWLPESIRRLKARMLNWFDFL